MIILKTLTFTSTTFKTMTPGVADFREELFQQWGLFENFKVHILLVPPMYLVEFCPGSTDPFFKKVEPCLSCKCRILLEQGHWYQVFSLFIIIIYTKSDDRDVRSIRKIEVGEEIVLNYRGLGTLTREERWSIVFFLVDKENDNDNDKCDKVLAVVCVLITKWHNYACSSAR